MPCIDRGADMRRREFITLLSSTAMTWPLAARAQQPVPVIGFLSGRSADESAHLLAAFHRGLNESGYVEGQNVAIEYRWAQGQYDRLPGMAADLVGRQVAVITTVGGELSSFAAKSATATIPIVFTSGTDPVKLGLVASLNRPGGNATGVNIFAAEMAAKRLGLLHELVSAGSIIAHLVNPNFPPTEANVGEVEVAARLIGRQILLLKASNEGEIDAAFATMSQTRAGAVLVGADPFFNDRREQIVTLAARHALPANYEQREFVEAGGLMSYGTRLTDAYRQNGIYVGRILKGEKPVDLPVVQLTKFTLIINLKTAKALGLTLPSGMLSIADEVVE